MRRSATRCCSATRASRSAPAAAGSCVVLCPTLGPASTEALAARLGERGIGCIDAPMSGGPARARDGSMSLMVACADALFDAPSCACSRRLSSKLFRVGERPGDGARTKLVNNLLAAINLAGAAEAIALAERLGLDAARTLAVIEQSSGQSWIGTDRMRRAIAGDWAPRAHTTLLAKDSRLALEMAEAAGFERAARPAPRRRHFAAACAAGFGALDDASLLAGCAVSIRRRSRADASATDHAALRALHVVGVGRQGDRRNDPEPHQDRDGQAAILTNRVLGGGGAPSDPAGVPP